MTALLWYIVCSLKLIGGFGGLAKEFNWGLDFVPGKTKRRIEFDLFISSSLFMSPL